MNPLYHQAHFLLSAPDARAAPPDEGAEVAFGGRSNAGKSSAINALTGQTTLARISKTPGRTQQIIFFQLDEQRRLVDLPGYGYAKVPKPVQARWRASLEDYLTRRQSLRGIVVLMDIRRPLTDVDVQMLAWSTQMGRPTHVLLTKSDKLRPGAARAVLQDTRRVLAADWGSTVQLFSARKRAGVKELQARLDEWLEVSASLSGLE